MAGASGGEGVLARHVDWADQGEAASGCAEVRALSTSARVPSLRLISLRSSREPMPLCASEQLISMFSRPRLLGGVVRGVQEVVRGVHGVVKGVEGGEEVMTESAGRYLLWLYLL